MEERGFAIRTTIIITLLMTFLMTFLSIGGEATYMAYGGDARMQVLMMEKLSKGLSFIFISIYWLVMMVGVSMVFRNMRTKQQRIAYMMLPASNMEKYVTRVVMVALGGLLMSVVSFVLADQLQMVFIKLIFGDTHIGSYVMASASMLCAHTRLEAPDSASARAIHASAHRERPARRVRENSHRATPAAATIQHRGCAAEPPWENPFQPSSVNAPDDSHDASAAASEGGR